MDDAYRTRWLDQWFENKQIIISIVIYIQDRVESWGWVFLQSKINTVKTPSIWYRL